MKTSRSLPEARYFEGISWLESGLESRLPQRISQLAYEKFNSNPTLLERARCGAGIRLRFTTQSPWLDLLVHFPTKSVTNQYTLAIWIDGKFQQTLGPDEPTDEFRLPVLRQRDSFRRDIEVHWPTYAECHLLGLEGEEGYPIWPMAPDPRKKLLLLGDSITQGAGCHPQESFAFIISKLLNLNPSNCGLGGATFPSTPLVLTSTEFDLAVVALGTNDFGGQLPLADFLAAATEMLETLRRQQPEAPIVLLTPLTRTGLLPTKVNWELENYRQTLREIAESGKGILLLEGPELLPEAEDSGVLPDGVHPNPSAHQLIGERVAEKISEAFPEFPLAGG